MSKETGYVLWEGPSPHDGTPIVVIATMKSKNDKTGDMVQVWILVRDKNPLAAVADGSDAAICGHCPLRKVNGKRVCYVNLGQAPLRVWRKYEEGGYRRLTTLRAAELLAGRSVRLGAYGDPSMIPYDYVDFIMQDAHMWTGYTHQWRTTDRRWSRYLMASCETEQDRADAESMGYRWFGVVPKGAGSLPGAVQCAAERERNPLQCKDCGMCGGTRRGTVSGAVSVWIEAHGSGAKHLQFATSK